MISVFVMVYNEEKILQFFIDHYRKRFPGCLIDVYDNESTDSTAKIARDNDCVVRPYYTAGQVNDDILRGHKNNVWRNAETDWVLVCDADELLDIDECALKKEAAAGTTAIVGTAYDMVNLVDSFDYASIKHGIRNSGYDKLMLFDKSHVSSVDYEYGAHRSHPKGNVRRNATEYLMLHYYFIDVEYAVQKRRYTDARMSKLNRVYGLGCQYLVPDSVVRDKFVWARTTAAQVLP